MKDKKEFLDKLHDDGVIGRMYEHNGDAYLVEIKSPTEQQRASRAAPLVTIQGMADGFYEDMKRRYVLHDELVAALRAVTKVLVSLDEDNYPDCPDDDAEIDEAELLANAVLAKVDGGAK